MFFYWKLQVGNIWFFKLIVIFKKLLNLKNVYIINDVSIHFHSFLHSCVFLSFFSIYYSICYAVVYLYRTNFIFFHSFYRMHRLPRAGKSVSKNLNNSFSFSNYITQMRRSFLLLNPGSWVAVVFFFFFAFIINKNVYNVCRMRNSYC